MQQDDRNVIHVSNRLSSKIGISRMLSPEDLEFPAGRKLMAVLGRAGKTSVTDIEIREGDMPRLGVLKSLVVVPDLLEEMARVSDAQAGRVAFSRDDIMNILSRIMPANLLTDSGVPKFLPCCFSFSIMQVGHYRVTVAVDRIGLSLTIRRLPFVVPDYRSIGVPDFLKDLVLDRLGYRETAEGEIVPSGGVSMGGLLVISGLMGSGKTTTAVSLLQFLADAVSEKIVTIENPIEYVLSSGASYVQQFEIGTHVKSFSEACYHLLRSNLSILFIGEIRSREELLEALHASVNNGYLVLTTYHAHSAVQALARMVNDIGSEMGTATLCNSLIGIMNQRLLYRADIDRPRFFMLYEFLPMVEPVAVNVKAGNFTAISNQMNDGTLKKTTPLCRTMFDSIRELSAMGIDLPGYNRQR